MHIPDGVLDARVVVTALGVSAAAVALAARRVRTTLPEERLPLVGVLGAFVFAAQMVNLPIPGTPASMHLTGACLLAVLLGPSAAILALAAVLLLQALIFQDGGLWAWGANTLNMAVVGAVVSHLVYRVLNPSARSGSWQLAAAGLAAALSVLVGAVAVAAELILTPGYDPAVVWAGVLGGHLFFAIGEGVITAISIAGIRALAPDLAEVRSEVRP